MSQNFDVPVFASADQIRRREFVATRRGYDPDQVRAYLEQLADQVEQLESMLREARLRAETTGESTSRVDPYEEVASRVAGALRAADEGAQRLLSEARTEVDELLSSARAEADRIKAEAQATAEAALVTAETTVREAREHAGKAVVELAARREALLERFVEMQERLTGAAGELETVIRSRGEDLPPLSFEIPTPAPARAAAEPASTPNAEAPRAAAPEKPLDVAEATVLDPAYAELWNDLGDDELQVPEIPAIDLSWGEEGTDSDRS